MNGIKKGKKEFEIGCPVQAVKICRHIEKQLSNREENLEKKARFADEKKDLTLQTTGKEIADRQKRLIERENELIDYGRRKISAGKNAESAARKQRNILYQNLIETVNRNDTNTERYSYTTKITGKKRSPENNCPGNTNVQP